jgi:periplasmic protein TonB
VSGLRLPLAVSIAGHAIGLILLVWLSSRLPPLVLMPPAPPNAVAVIFEAPPAPPQPAPAPTPPPPAKIEPPPPPPPLPKPVEVPKPVIHEPPKPRHIVRKRIERPVRREEPEQPPPVEAPQTAALPPAPPVYQPPPAIRAAWQAEVYEWLNAHKRYPESARERNEEGKIVVSFSVDRSGRVLSVTIDRSSGYTDIDASVEEMLRGATVPAFPAGMYETDERVTAALNFQLE